MTRSVKGQQVCAGPAEVLGGLSSLFRQAMSEVALSVHIVTSAGPAGIGGLTASSICSVSADPPIADEWSI
jgi:hypothetical protein